MNKLKALALTVLLFLMIICIIGIISLIPADTVLLIGCIISGSLVFYGVYGMFLTAINDKRE